MQKNNVVLIWIEEVLLAVVLLFTLWGAMKGAYAALIVSVVVAFFMYRQWRTLQAINAPDEEEDADDEMDEE